VQEEKPAMKQSFRNVDNVLIRDTRIQYLQSRRDAVD